jgi:hypothetical protein
MIKKVLFFVLFIGLTGCGYQPIFLEKNNQNFQVEKIQLDGDKKINRQIIASLNIKKSNTKNPSYILKISSSKNIQIISKDKLGNADVYRSNVSINLTILNSSDKKEIIKERKFNKNFSYNTTSNKFDLSQYQKDIEKNLTNEIIGEIFIFLNE